MILKSVNEVMKFSTSYGIVLMCHNGSQLYAVAENTAQTLNEVQNYANR